MFTLEYPATGSPVSTIILSNPEFGNNRRVDANIISRESRHGTALGVRDQDWPVLKTRFFNFTTLTKTVAEELQTFLLTYAGLRIKIIDYNNETSTGFIATNNNEFITMNGSSCSYDVSFEFMEDPS